MIPLVGDDDINGRNDNESFIDIDEIKLPLVDKEDIRKKAKSKRGRYGYIKKKIVKLIPLIYEGMYKEGNWRREIKMRVRDIAKDLGLENKSDITIYSGLRFVLFFEGIDVSMKNNEKENFLTISMLEGAGAGLPRSILKTFDNIDLNGWYIKKRGSFLESKHNIRKEYGGDTGWTYILESEGNIYFDRRNLTEEQALEFVKYMSGKGFRAPDFVYMTPINVVLNEKFLDDIHKYSDFDEKKIGIEFRIVKSDNGFVATSIYGKECVIPEFEIDSLIKACYMSAIIYRFDKALMVEKLPERVEILKKIIPEIKTKNIVMINDKKLIINNSIGTFHISLIDGTLHKIYDQKREGEYRSKYICVGPTYGENENFIIYNGIKYKIDKIMVAILAKSMMLLEEKYPDNTTRNQIMT